MGSENMFNLIQILIDLGANIHAIDRSGNTILHELVSMNNSYSKWWQLEQRAKQIVALDVHVHSVNH
jgi:crotonobetainyl-CoA:carnitine CoA-transferase CaiB-like acyl-CoA transferase